MRLKYLRVESDYHFTLISNKFTTFAFVKLQFFLIMSAIRKLPAIRFLGLREHACEKSGKQSVRNFRKQKKA